MLRLALLKLSGSEGLDAARATGPYQDLDDFRRRTGLEGAALAGLAAAGAFGCFGLSRRAALWAVEAPPVPADGLPGLLDADPAPPLRRMTLAETLAEDYRVLGFSPVGHLLILFRDALAADGVRPLADLSGLPPGMRVRVAGLVQIVQRPPTARGMCFLTLEDETALGNAALRPDIDARYRAILADLPLVVMEGTLQRVESVTSLLVTRVWPIGAVDHVVT